jgi:hypothetical protein
LTKEFALPAILRFPGLTDFDEQIGVPVRFGEKAAICDAVATWYLRGELHEVRCVKSESIDARIVVNCYATSSPDELRGKVQSKLYRRVLSRLTGLNLCPDDSDADASNTIDATPRAAVANIAAVETAVDPEAESSGSEMTDSEAAKLILADAEKEFAAMTMKTDVKKYVHNRNLLIAGYAWSEDMKMATSEALVELADARIAEIGASRGK